MKHNVNTKWNGKMQFDSVVNGHHITIDLSKEGGGDDKGPRPKPLMLAALAGCTGIDTISILTKMRVEVDEFHVDIEGDTSDEVPNPYVKIHIVYKFRIKNPEMDKIEKAVSMSMDRYCGVMDVYRRAGIDISHEIKIL
jgi:putative redox protein